MAPNSAEATEKRDEDVRDHDEVEDEVDGGRGEYGRRSDYDYREGGVDSVFRRDDCERRRRGSLKRSDSGQRGDYGQRGDSQRNEDFVKRVDDGVYVSRKDSYVMGKGKYLEPDCVTYPAGLQDWEDREFPYGRLRGNYRQSRFDGRIDNDERERRYDGYESDFDRYGWEGRSSYYDADRKFGRSPSARSMARYRYDEPYSFRGYFGRERKPFTSGKDYCRPEYDRMDYERYNMYGKFENGMRNSRPYGFRFGDSFSPFEDNYGGRIYGRDIGYNMANRNAKAPYRSGDYDRYGGYYGRPDLFGFGYGRDEKNRDKFDYLLSRYNDDIDNYGEGPYRKRYGLQDRDFFVDRYEMNPFRRNYAISRYCKSPYDSVYGDAKGSDIYSSYGRYGVEPSREIDSKSWCGIPGYARDSFRSRCGNWGFDDDQFRRFQNRSNGQHDRRQYGHYPMNEYGYERALPRIGNHVDYRLEYSGPPEAGFKRRMMDGLSRVHFSADDQPVL